MPISKHIIFTINTNKLTMINLLSKKKLKTENLIKNLKIKKMRKNNHIFS